MYIESIELQNFTGIFNGLQRNQLKLDFRKNPNRIILISGNNGTGKSTLLNSLHPFSGMYDNCNNEFSIILEGKNGFKEIIIRDNENNRYRIQHHYLRSNKTKSYTVKSFISEYNWETKEWVELNDRGVQATFNDIVWNKLHCNQNILQISKMGSNVSSFITKKSTERKEYISQLLPNIEEYLTHYRTVSKKITVYNNDLKVIAAQLDKYGKMDLVEQELISVTSRFKNLSNELEEQKSNLSKIRGRLELLNSSNLKEEIGDLISRYREIKPNSDITENEFYEKYYSDDLNELIELKGKVDSNTAKYGTKVESVSKRIMEVNAELEQEKNSVDEKYSDEALNTLKQTEKRYVDEIEKLKKISISKNLLFELANDYDSALQLKYLIVGQIVPLVEQYDLGILSPKDADYFLFSKEFSRDANNEIEALKTEEELLKFHEDQLTKLEKYSKFYETLKLRPKKCKIDDCPFITQANEFRNEINLYQESLNFLNDEENQVDEDRLNWLETWKTLKGKIAKIDFSKFTNDKELIQKILIECLIQSRKERIVADYIPDLMDYFIREKSLDEYEKNLKLTREEIKTIEVKKKAVKKVLDKIDRLKETLNELEMERKEVSAKYHKFYKLSTAIYLFIEYNQLVSEKEKLRVEIEKNKDQYKEILDYEKQVQSLENIIRDKSEELDELNEAISNLKVKIGLIKETEKRKEEIEAEYNDLKVLRDSLSPSKGLILIYSEAFLERTKSIANEMLENVYDRLYRIFDFELNEDEFAIKIEKKERGIIPDIRRCSSGEISMTGVTILFALIEQSISHYNIIALDELDGPLDDFNKRSYVEILDKQLTYLNVDQCFLISHNDFFADGKTPISTIEFPGFALNPEGKYCIASF